jgi:hypothetical protein
MTADEVSVDEKACCHHFWTKEYNTTVVTNNSWHNGATTLRITTFRFMKIIIKDLYVTPSISDTQCKNVLPLCWVSFWWVSHIIFCYDECHYAECCGAGIMPHVTIFYADCFNVMLWVWELPEHKNFIFKTIKKALKIIDQLYIFIWAFKTIIWHTLLDNF